MLTVGTWEGKPNKKKFKQFFFYKNDMRYIIPYSFSQQNEFYKVYNTKQNKQKNPKNPHPRGWDPRKPKKGGGKKNHSSTKLLTLQHQYLCRSIYTNVRVSTTAQNTSQLLTGDSKVQKTLEPTDNVSRTPQNDFQWLQWYERCSFYSQIFTRSIQTGKFL